MVELKLPWAEHSFPLVVVLPVIKQLLHNLGGGAAVLIQATDRFPLHLAPPRADYEQAFAGANFNTEIVSGAPLRSPEHIF